MDFENPRHIDDDFVVDDDWVNSFGRVDSHVLSCGCEFDSLDRGGLDHESGLGNLNDLWIDIQD